MLHANFLATMVSPHEAALRRGYQRGPVQADCSCTQDCRYTTQFWLTEADTALFR